MSEGRHAAAGKSAGWTLLVAAEIIGSLALVGLAIYWLTVATTLALFGVNSLLLVALFIKSVVQRREDRWFPWLAAGALATTTVVFAIALAKRRHWSASSLHSLALISDVVFGVAAGVFGVVAVIWIWTVAVPWFRQRFAHS